MVSICGGCSKQKWKAKELLKNDLNLFTVMQTLFQEDLETFNHLMLELLKAINIHCVNSEHYILLILAIYYRNQAMIDWIF